MNQARLAIRARRVNQRQPELVNHPVRLFQNPALKNLETLFLSTLYVVGQFEGTSSEFNLQVADAKAQAQA